MNRLVKHYPAAVSLRLLIPLFRQTESVDELAYDIIHTIRADDVGPVAAAWNMGALPWLSVLSRIAGLSRIPAIFFRA